MTPDTDEEFIQLQEELSDYEDLRILRDTKEKETAAPTVKFSDVKKNLGL